MATSGEGDRTGAAENSFFAKAPCYPRDAIFALTAEYHKDSSPEKINLGQGAYRDETGQPWVLPSVREARNQLQQEGLTHEYLPILGLPEFREAVPKLVMGEEEYARRRDQIATCQALSGTGAIHLAGLLVLKSQSTQPKVYIPNPTWSNHRQVFESLGYEVVSMPYYDHHNSTVDITSYLDALKAAEPGSIIVLHACAHNPTGYDPSQEQWREIGEIMKEHTLLPFFDGAYLGFNSGSVAQDAFAIRHFISELEMEAVICISFAKNMGLYGERVGCLIIVSGSSEVAGNCSSTLERLQRVEVSNPPAYGARIATKVLSDPTLRQMWFNDLQHMSSRIRSMRSDLYYAIVNSATPGLWKHLTAQSGMFGFLGLTPAQVHELKVKHHIYMAENSRISIAGLNKSNVSYVGQRISDVVRQSLLNE